MSEDARILAGAGPVWRSAFEISGDIYRELTYEFFSTYHLSCAGIADGKISYEEFAAMMKTGTYWRKASRHYSRGRFNSLSVKLMKDGSLNLGNSE
ncbi:hypothetical protein L1987_63541 [Smallanthus sonchifolius]|uniref:Uncharacterized protein n=1 Tax=Smallanthus sonchifolius TaxID=185202 RepID=A0ACB9CDJ9_9ASTR|nr:hypothetical protein L1987_63541 [Smallanthus sonchifolius]